MPAQHQYYISQTVGISYHMSGVYSHTVTHSIVCPIQGRAEVSTPLFVISVWFSYSLLNGPSVFVLLLC